MGDSLEGANASSLRGCAHGMVAVAGWNLKDFAGLNPEGNTLEGAHAGLGGVQVRKMPGNSAQATEAQRERHVHALGQAPLQAHGAGGHSEHAMGVLSAEVAAHLIHTLITCRHTHTDEVDPYFDLSACRWAAV